MLPGLPNPYLCVAALLTAMGLFIGGYLYGGHVTALAWEASTAKLQAQAAATLAQETAKTAQLETAAATLADKVETAHADAEKNLAAVVADYDARLRGKRLRDPSGGPGGSCSTGAAGNPAKSGADAPPAGGCTLSDAASDGLKRIALEADAFRLYSLACHDWAVSLGR